jgi:hypothetical protein
VLYEQRGHSDFEECCFVIVSLCWSQIQRLTPTSSLERLSNPYLVGPHCSAHTSLGVALPPGTVANYGWCSVM